MGRWALEFLPQAEDDFAKLDHAARGRVINKLDWFVANFDSVIPIPLAGEYRGFFKLRIGDIRIFYKITRDRNIIVICYIDWRDKAYKKT